MTVSVGGGVTGQGNISRLLQSGVNAIFQNSYNDYTPEYSVILDVQNSERAYEEDVPYAGFGLAKVKPEGSAIQYDDQQTAALQRYTHIVYALGGIITAEAIEDNLYQSMIPQTGKMLRRSLIHTKELVAANIFNEGYNATFPTWDGKALFAADHDLIKGGTYSNVLPTPADISEAALEDMIIAIEDFRDDAGLLLNAMPKSLHIPRQLKFIADRILASSYQNDTANNAINSLMNTGSLPEGYFVNHRFDSPNDYFIRTGVEDGGKMFIRREDVFEVDNDFGTSNWRGKGYCRFSVGVSDPRQYYGSGQVP